MTVHEKRRLFHTFLFPGLFLGLIWLIRISESVLEVDLATLGVYPRELKGIPGIFFSPLIHSGFSHLISNSVPLLLLMAGLFYFYHSISYRVFALIYLAVGLWVWVAARQSYHIGASGVVYGLAAFHVVSAILRRHVSLMSFALLIVFLYGSMIWGVLPLVESISFESHLLGAVAGLICAIVYRKQGIQRKEYNWDELEEQEQVKKGEDDDYHDIPPGSTNSNVPDITYEYVEKKKEE